uniref:NADH-ubiquinone oxidoreductase chain 6 n=1 Tax=Serritermes serrifer TaxID=119666 RepID=A0A0A7E7T4_9NEOP|nr:NADH dehydrogenase subunit 6 [Serritermes serrifer]
MKLLLSMSSLTGLMFTQSKHPMAMGMALLIQTMLMCMISGVMYKSFWFSYILFMIMIGGMLVLFMYMTSLASNEMFRTSSKMITATVLMMPIITYVTSTQMNNKEMLNHETMMENETFLTTTMMYNSSAGSMTIMLVIYMLLTLIIVVNMVNISKGPLRQST